MAERFENKYNTPENLYVEGSPVLICAGALLKDTVTGKMLVQLKMRNIGTNMISAVKVKIKAFEPNGAEIEGVEEYQFIDLNAAHADEFGQKTPIYLPNNSTRKFEVGVTEVVFSDTSPWVSDFIEWTPLEKQKYIASVFNDKELIKQYAIEVGKGKHFNQTADYIPDEPLDLFRCTCGDTNPKNTESCMFCGRKKEIMFKSLNTDYLKSQKDIRLEEEKKQAEQKEQEIAEKKEIQKAKLKKFRNIAIPVGAVIVVAIFLVILFTSIIPGSKYNEAKELLNKGKYDKAYTMFSELGDYEDAKKMCEKAHCEKAAYLLNEEKYTEALKLKEKIPANKWNEIVNKKTDELKTNAESYYDSEKYQEASKEYNKLIDAYSLLTNCSVEEGKNELFTDTEKKKIEICNYYVAKDELSHGNLKEYKRIITNILINGKWYEIYHYVDRHNTTNNTHTYEYEYKDYKYLIFKNNGKVVGYDYDDIDKDYKNWSITKSGKLRIKWWDTYLVYNIVIKNTDFLFDDNYCREE